MFKISNYNSYLSQFRFFYFFQLFVFIAGLARSTAIGVILSHLDASALTLGIISAVVGLAGILGYVSYRILSKRISEVNIFILCQKALVLGGLAALIYGTVCFYDKSWGHIAVWTLFTAYFFLFISLEQISRPKVVKSYFPIDNYQGVMRQDFMILGLAKVFGFGVGVFLDSLFIVLVVFIFAILFSFLNYRYSIFISKLPNILNKAALSPIINSNNSQNTNIPILNTDLNSTQYISHMAEGYRIKFKSALALQLGIVFIIFSHNTQAITYQGEYGVPFYWFFTLSSAGNLFFNSSLGKLKHLKFNYLLNFVLLISGFLIFIFAHSAWVIAGSFLIGAAQSGFGVLATSRAYHISEQPGQENLISKFFIFSSITNMIGAFLIGVFYQYIPLRPALIGLTLLTFIYFLTVYFYATSQVNAWKERRTMTPDH